ncbi:hypothetical protein QA596_10555 [Balneolales bacterium ANBcel1]|nr:hypothetical protein [Balneolales bacterium ANBcel1]
MEIFRAHIIKLAVLLLFVAGTALFVWPSQSDTQPGESVSSWLFDLRTNKDNPVVYQKISSLRTQEGDIPGLLRKASSIVSEHADDFSLPVDSTDSSDDDIYNTLLLKWTIHQQETMTRTVTIADRQTQVPPANEEDDQNAWNQLTQSIDFVIGAYGRISEAWEYIRIILRPLASGIAIGAP